MLHGITHFSFETHILFVAHILGIIHYSHSNLHLITQRFRENSFVFKAKAFFKEKKN